MSQPTTGKGILYGRKWEIKIFAKGEENSDSAMDVSHLRCVWKTQSQDGTPTQLCTLTVYNMNDKTEKAVIQQGFQFSIFAGYEAGQYGEIFTGDIMQVIRNRENGTDYKLEMIAIKNALALDVNLVRTNIAAGSTPRDLLRQVAETADEPLEVGEISENLPETALPRGKVYFGKVSKYFRDMCIWHNGWYERKDGKLEVHLMQDEIPDGMSLELTPTTGLVGTPRYTDHGINIKMLMDARVKLHTLIKIDNEIIQRQLMAFNMESQSGQDIAPQQSQFDATGEYEVISISHQGDTYGDTWITDVMAMSRNGRASLVSQMENAQQSVRA